jgi:tripartite-type tricarboxylate transporter receptor subunit TctC
MNRRALLILAASLATPFSPLAAEWPTRPVTFVVPAGPGSSADLAARTLASRLSVKWKQPVVVENKPGGGTTIATSSVARSAADGHTFGWVIAAHSTNPALRAKLPYDTLKDLAGVTLVYQLHPVIVATPGFEASTVDELVALARRKPGMFYTSSGVGTGPHLLAELFRQKHGLDLQHIPHKEGGAARLDVLTGRIPLMFDTLPSALPAILEGRLKALAVISDMPVASHPSLPILRDLLPREALVGWNGIIVPAATPRDIVKRLNADLIEAINSPGVQEIFGKLGVRTLTSTPEEFDAFVRADVARWSQVIGKAGIKLD